MDACRTYLLLLILFQTLASNVFAQERDVVRADGELYIKDNGQLYRIDQNTLLAQVKQDRLEKYSSQSSLLSKRLSIICVSVPQNVAVEKYKKELETSGDFEIVEFNSYFKPSSFSPNDTYLPTQWYLDRIKMPEAWDITTGDSTIKVAIIDNGVSCNHPDLGTGTDGYANVKVSLGYNFVANTTINNPTGNHGTMIAGIVGAKTNNSLGISGISGGNGFSGITIIPYQTDYSVSKLIMAINDAVIKGAKVVNLSLYGAYNSLMENSIHDAYQSGVCFVCATGNDHSSSLPYPASSQYTIAVGATNSSDQISSFSNYGTGLDLVAPGESIYSTSLGTAYASLDGTSFSAPQVAGTVALMLSSNPNLTPSEVKTILRNTATRVSGYTFDSNNWNKYVGCGLLNALKAVLYNYQVRVSCPDLICTQDIITISGLPASAGVALNTNYSLTGYSIEVSPTLSIVSYSSGLLTVQKVSNGPGYVKVYYKGYLLSTREFWVGAPIPDDVYFQGGHFYIVTDALCNADLFQYIVINGTRYKCLGGMSSSVFLSNGTYNAEVILKNDCGESHTYWPIVVGNSGYYTISYVNNEHQVAIKALAEHEDMASKSNSTIAYILQSVSSGRIIAEGVLPITGGVINFSHVKHGQYVLVIKPDGKEPESFKLSLN